MSGFFSSKYASLTPYIPGEQPQDKTYIKLNTNESPFPPAPGVARAAAEEAERQQLYSDPTAGKLIRALSEVLGVGEDEIICGNGSDEILHFLFMAYCDKTHPALFPDITYGFYKVFADVCGVPWEEKPLNEDFTVNVDDYIGEKKTVFIANPNAPTGIALSRSEVERIVAGNPDNIVVIDEAYVDFGGESAVPLISRYPNLVVTQTFSKSRSLAGGRLGIGIACPERIAELSALRYSTNPYNVNRMTMASGIAALRREAYTKKNCEEIIRIREETKQALLSLGFYLTDSSANFLFAAHPDIGGGDLYRRLKEKGVLVRHFDTPRICDFVRITVGSREDMAVFLTKTNEILEEIK